MALRHAAFFQRALVAARTQPRLCVPIRAATTLNDGASKAHDHSTHFKIERYFAAGMIPLLPAAYFIHGPVMDAALTVALTLHIHWGVQGVIADYARPFVIGPTAAKAASFSLYLISAALLAAIMGKKNSKVQRKKFFSHPKNKGKIFKKKPTSDGNTIRKRGNFIVLPTTDLNEIPNCQHGPCLLFGKKEDGVVTHRYFACAVYRNDPDSCDYKAEIDLTGQITAPETKLQKACKWNYGCIPKKLNTIAKETTLVFCRECNDVFADRHSCPSEVVTRKQMKYPSRFLEPLDKQNGEAQFFFSDDSLNVLLSLMGEAKVDGILCLGTPRIFETLKSQKSNTIKLFLLDIDKRYAHFFPSSQFAQYSMLVHHFYHTKSIEKLNDFFSKCKSVLLVCDPPFGLVMEPLLDSLKKIEKMHFDARSGKESSFNSAILVPFFVGKHILRLNSSYWMSDYRVTYENHKDYNKPNKTTVRIFTDLLNSAINLSNLKDYKYCEMCEKHVHESNKHCFVCQICPSKDGSQMRHCDRCSRCFKINTRHCRECSRCHLPGRCLHFSHSHEDDD